ncbi:pyrroloquinoline quinone biosynthesis protein PqqB [Rhizobium sp. 18055]|uniref:pyrroloquinoline quinone biosynthesis protein PqqB n=1 Tax=Rhizobium sp. 18055 TaxID=2681403 RepID=UPI00135B4B82|nr:pyrroloquinoline quinone biosynthesis protein PqqB [Rhizobium sp. 18055]
MTDSSGFRGLVLGAAAGGGLPQWNCGCQNCRLARDPASGVRPQSQSSLAVSLDGDNWAILNASPDIRQQIVDNRALHPRMLRDSPIKSVLITNGDIDHLAGLLILREKQPLDVFVTSAIGEIIDDNPVFRALDPAFVTRYSVVLERPFSLLPGLEARLFAVPGKVPLFMEDGEPELQLEGEQTVGVELTAGDARVYYIPGCAHISDALKNRIDGADALLFDGTVFTDDEMITVGVGQKTGQRMGHMAISGADGSLSALAGLDIAQKMYVHINNTNPIWRAGPERDMLEESGFHIGYDGMEIDFDSNT